MPMDAPLTGPQSDSAPGAALVALVIASATAIFMVAVLVGITNSIGLSTALAVPVAILAGMRQRSRPTVPLDWSGSPRMLVVIGGMAAVIMLVLVGRLSVFMMDPQRTGYSTAPASTWELRHSCLTAYYVAGDVVRRTPNIYEPSLYAAPGDDPAKPRTPQTIGMFRVDQYEYPPTFLLAPRAVMAVAPGFLRLRATWFGLNGLVLLAGLLAAARAMGPAAGTRALLVAPFVLGAYGTLNTLQKGNVQLVVIALAVLGMAAIERRRHALGGALLAFVTVSKLYPGLLLVYLLVRRDWRALAATAAFAALFIAVTLVDVGWQPFLAFRDHFSGLVSGEAFPAFRNPGAVAINLSIPGIIFKLKLFGATGLGFSEARVVGTIYMLFATAATILLAWRTPSTGTAPLMWLTVLLLATLRSPFLPWAYGTFPALWLVSVMAAAQVPRRAVGSFIVAALALGVMLPVDTTIEPRTTALISAVPQLLMIALAAICIRHQWMPVARYRAVQPPSITSV
jgi:alpha-1,2-mannosyltransferase